METSNWTVRSSRFRTVRLVRPFSRTAAEPRFTSARALLGPQPVARGHGTIERSPRPVVYAAGLKRNCAVDIAQPGGAARWIIAVSPGDRTRQNQARQSKESCAQHDCFFHDHRSFNIPFSVFSNRRMRWKIRRFPGKREEAFMLAKSHVAIALNSTHGYWLDGECAGSLH